MDRLQNCGLSDDKQTTELSAISKAHHPCCRSRDFGATCITGWQVTQEVAKQLVSTRLRSPWGAPTALFAALEKGLHQALLASEHPDLAEKGPEKRDFKDPLYAHHRCWLLLEFIDALERNIHNAAEGAVERTQPPQPVLVFFVANQKASHLCSWPSKFQTIPSHKPDSRSQKGKSVLCCLELDFWIQSLLRKVARKI